MKNIMTKAALLIGSVLILSACNPEKWCARHANQVVPPDSLTSKDSIVVTQHDTIFKIAADSSLFCALLACDSLGNVYVKQIEGFKAGVHSMIPKVVIRDNYITVQSYVNEFEVFARWREKEIYKNVYRAKVYVKTTNILSWGDVLWKRLGYLFAIEVLAVILFFVVRMYLKLPTGFKILK